MTRDQSAPPLDKLHRWLQQHLVYPLAATSGLAMLLYLGERSVNSWHGPRLHVNLLLAWLPYLFALWADARYERNGNRTLPVVAAITLWFIFFPNAPYLITDYRYLAQRQGDLWQHILIFTSFSFCGLMLAMVSLYHIHLLVRDIAGRVAGWSIVVAATMLSGLGIYMGRFLRWNSWDLFTRPLEVVRETALQLDTPVEGILPIVFALIFSALLMSFYAMFCAVRRAPPMLEERAAIYADAVESKSHLRSTYRHID